MHTYIYIYIYVCVCRTLFCSNVIHGGAFFAPGITRGRGTYLYGEKGM